MSLITLVWYPSYFGHCQVLQIMQHQTIKVASQSSHQHLFINLTPFSVGFDLQMISFASAIFWSIFDQIWLIIDCVAWLWNLDTRLGHFAKIYLSNPSFQQNYLFYSIFLSFAAMGLQIEGDIRRSKRKLSIFLDLPDSSSFSQNLSISTPAEKKKKISFFS